MGKRFAIGRRDCGVMHRRTALVGVIVGAASIAMVAAVPAAAAKCTDRCNHTTLTATLSGANEIPGPGDPDGSGTAFVDITGVKKWKKGKKTGKVCTAGGYSGIAPPLLAGHIHEGGPTTDGPIVVPLFETVNFFALNAGCVEAKRSVLKKIVENPADFYVNLHNAEFPGGAIRGQLAKLP